MTIEEYILLHSEEEPSWLQKISRQTYANMLHPGMMSGHLQGRFLKMLAQMISAERILEIGTFVGYSALCFAEGIKPDGEVHTIDINDELQDTVLQNLALTDFGRKVVLHIGDAMEVIPSFEDESFDLGFIDGDKKLYTDYLDVLYPKIKHGGYVLADNTLWYEKVVSEEIAVNDKSTQAILEFNEKVAKDNRLEKIILPIRDGITIIRKK